MRIEHRGPTDATVRQLYGTAFACAKPGCRAELYELNADTGQHVLKSHVAHIHARSEGGPRWDPAMAEAENRSADNLLLLCLFHAGEIDIIPDQYPADMLRAWKQRQLADCLRLQRSWRINDDDIQEALAGRELLAALADIRGALPFNPRMRSRAEAWTLAVRQGHARRVERLTPFVPKGRRPDVLAWMDGLDDRLVEVPPGQVRVLVARMGAGKSEQAARWWWQGLQEAFNDPDVEIPVFLRARNITAGVQNAVVAELGRDPSRPCRIVIDNLDGVSGQQALHLLAEARELVQVWPAVSVLCTARPGIALPDEETLTVEPWSADRGAELVDLVLGEEAPWSRLWNTETADLLTTPLTALGLAVRIHAGRDTHATRSQLYAGLADHVLALNYPEAADEVWRDLAELAVRILENPRPLAASTFRRPLLDRLAKTGLVVADNGELAFALAVFEQYFASDALRHGLVSIETIASTRSFPRWRYAIAFAVSTSIDQDQEQLLSALARANPAALSWTLDEIIDSNDPATDDVLTGAPDEEIAALIARRDPTGELRDEPDLAIRAGLWLRGAEQALLTGWGPLAPTLSRHRDGSLVQWGVWLQSGYLTLARSRDVAPPPEVIKLPDPDAHLGLWHHTQILRFPVAPLGRWRQGRKAQREQLARALRRKTLPVPAGSVLAQERLYRLARFVHDNGSARRRGPIDVSELREKVATWMEEVNRSVWATWQGSDGPVDSDDVRWLSAHLRTAAGAVLPRPWPKGDRPGAGQYAYEAYSPELTLSIATDIVREALIGYRQLVERSFPAFGDALGLYSTFPAHVNGLVERPDATSNAYTSSLILRLHPDRPADRPANPTVDLKIVTDQDHKIVWEFTQREAPAVPTAFGPSLLQRVDLPLHHAHPTTTLAYRWLAHDLAEIGWTDHHQRFD